MKNSKKILPKPYIPFPQLAVGLRQRMLDAMGHKTILVYTMGKVGSSTVYQTLRANNVSQIIYHLHFLSQENIVRISEKYKRAGIPQKRVKIRQLLRGDIDHLTASKALNNIPHARRWYIVSLVRDPVSTFLSHVFQNPTIHRPYLLGDNGLLREELVQE
jgi:hypothetical protein